MIWAFLTRRFRLWLLVAVGVPLLRRLIGEVGQMLEHRTGETVVTRSLRTGQRHLERYDRRARRDARHAPRRPIRA